MHGEDPQALKSLGPLEDETGKQRFRIVSLRAGKGHAVARFAGIDDRSAAERLTNLELYVDRDWLPPLETGKYYHADLIGLRVEAASGEVLGKIVAVPNYGAGDLLEIAPVRGGETFLVPFTGPFVPEVDIEGGRVEVDLPDESFNENETVRGVRGK